MQISESAVARGVNADKQRSFKDRYVTDPTMFRVRAVMTTSISLHIHLVAKGNSIIISSNRRFVNTFLKDLKYIFFIIFVEILENMGYNQINSCLHIKEC